jgi:hypothetical protein
MLEIKHQRAFCDHGGRRVADSTLLELLGPTGSEEHPTHWTAETIHVSKVLSYRLISSTLGHVPCVKSTCCKHWLYIRPAREPVSTEIMTLEPGASVGHEDAVEP